ncbi:MAG TPA: GntR family transcriptional regulator [Chloroflexota bacterium]|nr:GntR family transcriptional regulator [Chloroflexota bacterium]
MDKFDEAVVPAPGLSADCQPREQLSRADSRPLHRQISDALRRQINAGELRPGDLLPSENMLMSRFGVARGTVRQALAALRADGTVVGSRGRPLAVLTPRLTQPLSELISFSAWIRSLGKQPSGVVVEFGQQAADEESAKVLDVPFGSVVYRLVRVRFADDEPLMIERTVFPPRVGDLLATVDLNHQSIYAELAGRGIVFASARHLVNAIPATYADARLLQVPQHIPLLQVRRHAFSPYGESLEWSDDRYLADRVNFTIETNASVPGIQRQLAETGCG